MKTDHRVKSQTQRAASDAIHKMMKSERHTKPVWNPSKVKYKVTKKNNLKVKISVDVERLQFFALILFLVLLFFGISYFCYVSFIYEPKIIIIPD
jgi:hypothetical protein